MWPIRTGPWSGGESRSGPFCKASLDDWMVRLDTCEGILSAGCWGCVEGEFSGIKVGFRSLMGGVVAGWAVRAYRQVVQGVEGC
jgi:hypothetical protein